MLGAMQADAVAFMAVMMTFATAMVWTIVHYVASMVKSANVEKSRREIAAYVAEGTITPDEAVRLLNAGKPASERSERPVA